MWQSMVRSKERIAEGVDAASVALGAFKGGESVAGATIGAITGFVKGVNSASWQGQLDDLNRLARSLKSSITLRKKSKAELTIESALIGIMIAAADVKIALRIWMPARPRARPRIPSSRP